jgi:hypothetical protein
MTIATETITIHHTESLEDIALYFETKAEQVIYGGGSQATKKALEAAWREAARFIRDVQLVGDLK